MKFKMFRTKIQISLNSIWLALCVRTAVRNEPQNRSTRNYTCTLPAHYTWRRGRMGCAGHWAKRISQVYETKPQTHHAPASPGQG